MARFVVEVMETWQMAYEVEAPSIEEAIAFVEQGMDSDETPECETIRTVEFHLNDRVVDSIHEQKD